MDCKLLKNSVLFRLKNKCAWGNSAKVKLTEEAVMELIGPAPASMTAEEAADRLAKAMARLKAGQRLIVSPEYDAIKAFQSETKKRVLKTYCNPSFIDEGLFTVKLDSLPRVVEELRAARERIRLFLLTAFLDVYDEQKAAALPVLGELWNEKLYPGKDKLAGAFDIEWRVTQLDIPEGLPPEIREEEERKLRETYRQAEEAITVALYTEFQGFLDHVVERLQPGDDGKRKKFNGDILGNLSEFVAAFNNRNTFDDARLQGLVARANDIVSKASAGQDIKAMGEALRSDEILRRGMAEALNAVKLEVDASISTLPSRTVRLEED